MFGGQFADLGGDQPGALGQHPRRAVLVFLVLQRHGVVGRVGHHRVGLGHFGHHAAARGLALLLADAGLGMRVAFAFLVFLAHVFLGHAQLLEVAPDLPWHVQQHDHQQRGDDEGAAHRHQAQRLGQRGRWRHVHQAQHVVVVAPQDPHRHATHQHRLGQRLDELDHGLGREHPLESGEQAQLGEIRRQRLARDDDPAQQHAGQHRDHRQQAEDRQDHHQRMAEAVDGLFDHHARVGHHALVERQPVAQHPAQSLINRAAAGPDRPDTDGQHHERAQFPGTRNLPLLARLFQAPGRGGFGFLEVAFFGHALRYRCGSRIFGLRAARRDSRRPGPLAISQETGGKRRYSRMRQAWPRPGRRRTRPPRPTRPATAPLSRPPPPRRGAPRRPPARPGNARNPARCAPRPNVPRPDTKAWKYR